MLVGVSKWLKQVIIQIKHNTVKNSNKIGGRQTSSQPSYPYSSLDIPVLPSHP